MFGLTTAAALIAASAAGPTIDVYSRGADRTPLLKALQAPARLSQPGRIATARLEPVTG